MKFSFRQRIPYRFSSLMAACALLPFYFHTNFVSATEVPPGFLLLPDGKIIAKDPANAKVPPGYYLRKNGLLVKVNDSIEPIDEQELLNLSPDGVPAGFHKMPDGTLMANNPTKAIAPPGYHLMPNGVLMANNQSGSGAGHHEHHGHGSHHGAGMWMIDYRYVEMYMDGMQDAGNELSRHELTDQNGNYKYMMVPDGMTMKMHMLMAMYGITDKSMFMLMLHYMENDMDMYSFDGTKSSMRTSGIADSIISGMFKGPHKLTFNVGLSLPTGGIDEKGSMTHFAGNTQRNVKYPYAMQLGSGSYELKQGINYEDNKDKIGWGGSYEYTARLNTNKNDYKLGNVLLVDGWIRWAFSRNASVTGKLEYRSQEQIKGYDPDIETNKNMSPTANATAYGGTRMNASMAIKVHSKNQKYSAALDLTLPIYQNLWGPQMEVQWIFGLQLGAMI